MDAIKNFVKVEVSTGYDASATTVVLKAGDGAKLPDPAVANYNLVWYNSTDYADPTDDPLVEISRITGKSTDTLTVVRPAVGNDYNGETSANTAQTHNTGGKVYKMILAATYKVFNDLNSAIPVKAAGSDVTTGTDDTKFATPKAIKDAGIVAVTLPVKNTAAEVNTGTDDAKFMTAKSLRDSILWNLPEGCMINGKIAVTVDGSGNLTVALKGMDGNDPSATNPVYVRMGGVIRSITAALSITTNAGTNLCNSGSVEFAAQEIDYFVFIGWDTGDATPRLAYSRLPYGNSVADFSGTATSERALQNASLANTDQVVNIGRFAAILSAGAGYTWSVNAFTESTLIQRPIYETRLLDWIPTWSLSGGTLTTTYSSRVGKYKINGKSLHVSFYMRLNTVSEATASKQIQCSMPFATTSIDSLVGTSPIGIGRFYDNSGGLQSGGWLVNEATNLLKLGGEFTDWGVSSVGASPNITLATGDRFHGGYDVAFL